MSSAFLKLVFAVEVFLLLHSPLLAAALDAPSLRSTQYIRRVYWDKPLYISKFSQRKLVDRYMNRFVSDLDIYHLTQEIKAYYIGIGYPTVSVFTVTDKIHKNILIIKLIYGFVEQITLNDNSLKDRLRLAVVSPFLLKEHLNLQELEQVIDQLNTLPSSRATMQILSGTLDGGSIVQIKDVVVHPYRLDIGLDNLGDKKSGLVRYKANLDLDNVFGLNEAWSLNYTINHPKVAADRRLIQSSIVGSASFCLGSYNFSSSHTISDTISPIYKDPAPTSLYKTYGKTTAFVLKKTLLKQQSTKLGCQIGLTKKGTSSYIDDIFLQTQFVRLTPIHATLSCASFVVGGQFTTEFTYHQGTKLWGSTVDTRDLQKDSARAQFRKFNASIFWLRSFPIISTSSLGYQIKVDCQYTPHYLYDSEQLTLSGFGAVRGLESSYRANNAYFVKNEITLNNLLSFNRLLAPVQFFLGIDFAHKLDKIKLVAENDNDKNEQTEEKRKYQNKHFGWATGIKYSLHGVILDASYARSIWNSPQNEFQVYLSCTISLHQIIESALRKEEIRKI